MRSLRGSVLWLLTALVVAGCALFRAEGPVPPDFTAGPELLTQWLRDHVGGTDSMKALVRVSLRGPQGNLSFDGLLFSARPDSLRLQGFSPLGQRMFDLVAHGEQVALRLDAEQRTIEGTIDELGQGLKLPALPQLLELMATMMIVPPDPLQRVALEREGKGRRTSPVLVFYQDVGSEQVVTRQIWLRRDGLPREEGWYNEKRTTRVRYDDYDIVGGRWQPRKIEAELAGGVTVDVTIKEWQPVAAWRPDDFQIHGSANAAARG